MLTLTTPTSTYNGNTTNATMSLGACISPTKQWATGASIKTGVTTPSDHSYQRIGTGTYTDGVGCIAMYAEGTGAVTTDASLVSMDSDGFHLYYHTASSNRAFAVLAFKGGNYDVGVLTKLMSGSPDNCTAPCTNTVSGESFTPILALIAGTGFAAATTAQANASLSIGAMISGSQTVSSIAGTNYASTHN
jgi:hypothetical protein